MPQAGFDPPFTAFKRRIYWMRNGHLSEPSHRGWINITYVMMIGPNNQSYLKKTFFIFQNNFILQDPFVVRCLRAKSTRQGFEPRPSQTLKKILLLLPAWSHLMTSRFSVQIYLLWRHAYVGQSPLWQNWKAKRTEFYKH